MYQAGASSQSNPFGQGGNPGDPFGQGGPQGGPQGPFGGGPQPGPQDQGPDEQ